MARLYANENFTRAAVEKLRELGHDVLTTLDANKAGRAIPDEEVLKFATSEDRAVISFNRRDFIRLHHESQDHAGIIVCTFGSNAEKLSAGIHEALRTAPTLTGTLVRVTRPA